MYNKKRESSRADFVQLVKDYGFECISEVAMVMLEERIDLLLHTADVIDIESVIKLHRELRGQAGRLEVAMGAEIARLNDVSEKLRLEYSTYHQHDGDGYYRGDHL